MFAIKFNIKPEVSRYLFRRRCYEFLSEITFYGGFELRDYFIGKKKKEGQVCYFAIPPERLDEFIEKYKLKDNIFKLQEHKEEFCNWQIFDNGKFYKSIKDYCTNK